jgi:tRNA pseudouridine38-40 synthase
MPRNVKLTLSYDGTDFAGWQTQPNGRTVQATLEAALAGITGETGVRMNASGRTDSGVHAVGQVANFRTESTIPAPSLLRALNANLPHDVVVREAVDVAESFDANRDAVRKMYRYVIHDGPVPSPFLRKYVCSSRWSLDAAAMSAAARCLVGTHDFRCFETEWPNRATSVRTITHLAVSRFGEHLWIDVEADGFLYNMVRAIAGTLMNVGRAYWPIERVGEILAAGDRTLAGPTAPPQGLFLMRVTYES